MTLLIRDIADVQAGYHSRGPIEPDPKGSHRIIQIRDFDEHLHLRTDQLTSFCPDGNPERYLVRQGDVLFLSRGQRNFAAVMNASLANTIVPSYFYIVKPKTVDVDPAYLAWFINDPAAQMQIRALVRGTQIPLIPKTAFESLEIKVPPLAVQRTIVELGKLMEREKSLCWQITKKRDELVRRLCLRRIDNSSIEREPKHG